ncbi:hypothetical protein RJ639_003425, partial [Escallonia herrerae]
MGIQTMGFHGSDQQSSLQPLGKQISWYSLSLDEVENQLGALGKSLGSMNLDELIKNVLKSEANQSNDMTVDSLFSAYSLKRQASLSLVRAFSGKTVNEVWREIQQGQKMRDVEEMNGQEREATLGEMTLEEFLVKAGLYVAEASLESTMGLENALVTQTYTGYIGLSPSTSIDGLSDTPTPSGKRGGGDAFEKTLERRLKRKIKNRESAACSRARKQAGYSMCFSLFSTLAYHNELVTKISRLEEENMKLNREK